MTDPRIIDVLPITMLATSIVVLFMGMFLNRKVRFLGDNYIPPAVTGGLLFAMATAILYGVFDVQFEFEMRIRDLLLLVFFSTVGLSARFSEVAAGGRTLAILVVVAGIFLVLQNLVAMGIALGGGYHPVRGLFAGSVSFAGGHGTAIAWGQVAEEAGFENATTAGLAFATFGLVMGGLVGGPIARRLMTRHGITGPTDAPDPIVKPSEKAITDANWLYQILVSLLMLSLCVVLGDLVNRWIADLGIRLPGFLTAMVTGILITNTADLLGRPLNDGVVHKFGEVALHIFLAMSMMALNLWALIGSVRIITVVLALQVLLMTIFAMHVVFRVMGRDYHAAVIASGFAGMGLGATPVAIANMDAIAIRYGPSPRAFLVVPLVGAFFLDILNAGTITAFMSIISAWVD
jgi:ESS family glutamate:Na+ symporter